MKLYLAGVFTVLLLLAAENLVEFGYVMAWMICRVITSGSCL